VVEEFEALKGYLEDSESYQALQPKFLGMLPEEHGI
jgi:hypothetical protein